MVAEEGMSERSLKKSGFIVLPPPPPSTFAPHTNTKEYTYIDATLHELF